MPPRRRILGQLFLPAFDCALSGPFDNLHLDPAPTIPDSLGAHHCLYLRFIGLTIYCIKFFLNLSQITGSVKNFLSQDLIFAKTDDTI